MGFELYYDREKDTVGRILFTFPTEKASLLSSETPHKRYRRRARRLYRILILISLAALVLAIVALYFGDEI